MKIVLRARLTELERFLANRQSSDFSYLSQGMTARPECPAGYNSDHNRVFLGHGVEAFEAAKRALNSWKMFDLGWVNVFPCHAPVHTGSTVAIVVRIFGADFLNACRIVYVVDESDSDIRRYGFAYGTLQDHAEMGEERFVIEWNRDDESVFYDLRAISRPRLFFPALFYPFTRALQRRFARDSLKAMSRASERRLDP